MAINKKQTDDVINTQAKNKNVVAEKEATEVSSEVEVQREENNILSTKATNNTVTLDSLVSVDATQQAIVPMELSLNDLSHKCTIWEKQAEKEQNYPLAAEFTNINNALGGLINNVRGLSQAALAFINKADTEEKTKKLKNGQLFVRDTAK